MATPPPTDLPDRAMLDACIAGDRSAWDRLIDRWGGLIIATARRAGLNETECEDVYQTVLATLIRRLPTIREPAALPKWLMTTTRLVARRVAHTSRRMVSMADFSDDRLSDDSEAARGVEQLEEAARVRRAMEELGEPCRTLLGLLFVNPVRPAYSEISSRLGIAVGSIGPMRARCLVSLAELYRGPEGGQTPQSRDRTSP